MFGYKKIPMKKLIQRLLYLIDDMFDNLKEESIKELKYNSNTLLNHFCIFIIKRDFLNILS